VTVEAPVREPGTQRLTWQLLPALALVAVGTTIVVQVAVRAVRLPVASDVPTAASTWSVVFGSLLLLGALLPGRLPFWLRAVVVVGALTAVATAVLAWPLHGTSYYFGGLESDQQFRTQYLTRLASDARLADQNYAGLPPFYPAGWFWPAGRVAAFLGVAPWAAYKPLALATVGLTPALSWCIWSRLVGWRTGVGVAVATLLAGLSAAATEPYSWPVAALIPAVAVVFWRRLTAPRHRGPSRLLAVGVVLGLAGSTYTLYGFFLASLCVVQAAVVVATSPADRRAAFRRATGSLAVVAGTAVLTALPAWLPFLLEALRSGVGENAAARFLPAASAKLPPVFAGDPWGWLLAGGLVAVLIRLCAPWGRRPDVLAALLVTVACGYGWYAASTVALLGGTTLLAFRFESIVVLALAAAGVLALAEVGRWGSTRVGRLGWPLRRAPLAAGLLVVLLVAHVAGDRMDSLDDRVAAAYRTPYPSGADAGGRTDPGREEGWSDALAVEIERLTGADPGDLVVLSTDYALLSFQPYRGFQQITPHYANPLAGYRQRADYLADLAASRSSGELLRRLGAAPWAPPTVFVLRREPDGLHLRLGRDVFPASPNVEFFDLVFRADLFTPPTFDTATVGPYLVAARRP
jgi:galactan 5-O-arabinofuranosyltransferase